MNRFFRDFLVISLPAGLLGVIFMLFTIDWNGAIIFGCIFGSLFGLSNAYRNAKELSKPVHPFSINRANYESEEVQSVFKPKFLPKLPELIFIILALLTVGVILILHDTLIISVVFLGLIVIFEILLRLIRSIFFRVNISRDGVEYNALLYRLKASWNDIARVELRGRNWYLVCNSANIDSIPLIVPLLKYIGVDERICLNEYASEFLESEMVKTILYHSKEIPIMYATQF